MKQTKLFLMLVMLAITGIAQAANNKLIVQNIRMEAGSSVTLDVALENETTNLMGFQCDIVLPEGLTLKLKNNGKPAATLGDRFEDTEHSISSSVTSSGAYRFIATSLDGEAIPETSGTLFTVTLQADASLAPGTTLAGMVKNIEFNTQDNQKVVFSDVTFNVSIPGDAGTSEVTVINCTREYGEANPTFEYTVEGEDLVGTPAITCDATPSSPVGTYDIVISQGTVTNSNVTYINGTLTVTKAPLTIKAGTYTKKQGEQNPNYTLTYEGFKNDETNEVLTKQPVISCEADANSTPGEYDVTVSGAEAQNYDISYVQGKLTVTSNSNIPDPGNNHLIVQDIRMEAGSSVTLDVALENEITNLMGFQCDIVLPEGLTLKLKNNGKPAATLGDRFGETEHTISSSVTSSGIYHFKVSSLDDEAIPETSGTAFTVTLQADASLAPGTTLAGLVKNIEFNTQDNQNVVFNDVTFNVSIPGGAGTSEVTVINCTREYGEANPTFEYTVEGEGLVGTPAITCDATPSSPVGTYDIVISQGTVTNSNVTYINGTLTVTKAPLTIKAGTYTKKQGEQNPTFTLTYEGFKNDETSEVLTKQPVISCEADANSTPGEYDVTVSGAEAQNYDISYVNGKLTVTAETEIIQNFAVNDISYYVTKQPDAGLPGEVEVQQSTFDSYTGAIAIPSEVTYVDKTYKVTSVGTKAFYGSDITSITIPKSVKSIGKEAFANCSDLASAKIGNGVTSIEDGVFAYCENLTSVKIGNNVKSIGEYAFTRCTSLSSITLPNTLESIGDYAFQMSTALASVELPGSVKTIGNGAFSSCSSLSSFSFEVDEDGNASLTSIGFNAFSNCALTSITIPNSVETIGNEAFSNNSKLTTVILGDGITEIKEKTFQECHSLFTVNIPDEVTSIGSYAFWNCKALTSIKLPESITTIGEYAFQSTPLKSIELPNSFTVIPDNAFNDNDFQYIKLGNKVKSIGKNAFASKDPVIEIGTSTPPTIDKDAFPNVEFLADVNVILPDAAAETAYRKAKVWEEMTFSNQNNITEVTVSTPGDLGWELFESGMQAAKVVGLKVNGTINAEDFRQMLVNMKSLLRLDLSDCNITEIPEGALMGKTQLKELTLPTKLQTIGKSAFQGCPYLTGELNLPSTITAIGDYAFEGTAYTTVKLPNALKTIGDYAFNNVPIKQKLTLPMKVTSVGASAFEGTQITGLNILDGVTSIGDKAFASTPIQGHVTIPDGVTYLGKEAFRNSQLSTVFLPNSIETLSEGLFQGCPNLNTVYVPDNYTAFDGAAFDGCGALTILRLSANLTSMGQYSLQNTPLEYLKVPSQVEVLSTGVLKNCKNLESLSLPANLKTVEGEALYGCTALRNLSVEALNPPAISNRSAIRGINTDLCLISIPTQSYRKYVVAEYWGQFVQMRNDIAVETAGAGEIAFESVEEDEEEEEVQAAPRRAATRVGRRAPQLASEEESMTYANNGSSVYVPQQGKVRFYIIPAEGEEILSATLDGEDIMPYIVDGVYTATADKKNAKLVVKFSGTGQGNAVLAGDVNGDGDVDIADAVCIVNHVVSKPNATFVAEAADANKDGDIDIADAVHIVNYVVGKINAMSPRLNVTLPEPQ